MDYLNEMVDKKFDSDSLRVKDRFISIDLL